MARRASSTAPSGSRMATEAMKLGKRSGYLWQSSAMLSLPMRESSRQAARLAHRVGRGRGQRKNLLILVERIHHREALVEVGHHGDGFAAPVHVLHLPGRLLERFVKGLRPDVREDVDLSHGCFSPCSHEFTRSIGFVPQHFLENVLAADVTAGKRVVSARGERHAAVGAPLQARLRTRLRSSFPSGARPSAAPSAARRAKSSYRPPSRS